MPQLCECLKDRDIFLGCRQDKNGRLDDSVALYLTKEKRLRVVYPTPELARYGKLWESGQFEVCIEYCPICGKRFKGMGKWDKANPNLGITAHYETYALDGSKEAGET